MDKGTCITSAIDFCEISCSTLRSHVQGITLDRKKGKASVLIPLEEGKLVTYLHEMINCEFSLTWLQLKIKVVSLVQDGCETPFKDGIFGNGWIWWFLNMHLEILLKSA